MKPSRDVSGLIDIMARLRDPETGCPWDVVQTFRSIAPYTLEEAYEVADAIERGDLEDLRDELGDLLLQVVFHARMAEEDGRFAFADVVEAITTKMIRRHPHVFAQSAAGGPADAKLRWDEIKAQEKAQRARARPGGAAEAEGLLADVPVGLPGLTRAEKLQKRAATVGFDWDDPRAVIAKIREELDEFETELSDLPDPDRLEDELGDVLFAVANLARHMAVDPEAALRRCNAKFMRRFRHIEMALASQGKAPADASLAEMEALWVDAKRHEAPPGTSAARPTLPATAPPP